MKIYENGVLHGMTPEEIAELEEAAARYEAEEKRRPLSLEEVQTMLIRQQVNTLAVDDCFLFGVGERQGVHRRQRLSCGLQGHAGRKAVQTAAGAYLSGQLDAGHDRHGKPVGTH